MNRQITIEMTETVTTTFVVDEHWLAERRMPTNLDTLTSGDFDEELFEALDSIDVQDPDQTRLHGISYEVSEREFVASTKED